MAAARIKRDEFVKRVTESRSEEYLSPVNDDDLSKSHSHVDLGPSQPINNNDRKKREMSATSEDVLELTVPTLSPTASIKSRADMSTSSFNKEQPESGVKRNQHRNLLKQAYQSLLSAILDPIAYLREKHNFEPKVWLFIFQYYKKFHLCFMFIYKLKRC